MNFLFVVAVFGFIACASAAPAEGDKKHRGPHNHQCLGKNLTFTEEMKTAMTTCHGKPSGDKTKTDEKKTKDHDHKHHHGNMTCQFVCKYKAFGLITADNKVAKDKIEGFVKQVFPETVTAALTTAFTSCADKNGANLEVKDGKCDSYDPLVKCIFAAVKENCKTEDAAA